MPLAFETSQWPVVICRAIGESTDDDIRDYLGTLGTLLARRERHVLIVDATSGKNLKSTHRKMVAEWNEAHAKALSQFRAGVVLATPSSILRGMITAIYWIHPAPFPYKAVDSLSSALAWAEAALKTSKSA